MMELMGSQQGCPNTVDSQNQEAAATPGMEGQRGEELGGQSWGSLGHGKG